MATEIELIEAVPGTKNKASDYNTNFSRMKTYIEDSMGESADYVQSQLTTYANVNTLATEGPITLAPNTINTITPTDTVTFSLPTITDATKYYQILVQVNMSTVKTINLGTTYFFDYVKPTLTTAGLYDLVYEYDNASNHWVCGGIRKGEVL